MSTHSLHWKIKNTSRLYGGKQPTHASTTYYPDSSIITWLKIPGSVTVIPNCSSTNVETLCSINGLTEGNEPVTLSHNWWMQWPKRFGSFRPKVTTFKCLAANLPSHMSDSSGHGWHKTIGFGNRWGEWDKLISSQDNNRAFYQLPGSNNRPTQHSMLPLITCIIRIAQARIFWEYHSLATPKLDNLREKCWRF